jgi:hypothetical protein
MKDDVRYVVINEKTLGYMACSNIDWFSSAGVLRGDISKGGPDWKNGPIAVLPTDNVRQATPEDFRAFRVAMPPLMRENCQPQ